MTIVRFKRVQPGRSIASKCAPERRQPHRLPGVAALAVMLPILLHATIRAGESDERVIRGRVLCRGGLKSTPSHVHQVPQTGERFEVEDSSIRVTPAGELANVAVIFVPLGDDGKNRSGRRESAPAKFHIRSRVAVPRVAAAHAGSAIEFANEDPWWYPLRVAQFSSLTSVLLAPEPNSASLRVEGKRFEIVRIDCATNDWTRAFLIVADTEVVAITDDKGEFEIRTRHDGEFELRLWHEKAGWIRPNDIRCPAREIAVEGKKLLVQPTKEATDLGDLEIDAARLKSSDPIFGNSSDESGK